MLSSRPALIGAATLAALSVLTVAGAAQQPHAPVTGMRPSPLFVQPAKGNADEKHPHGVFYFKAGVGSFKVLGANEVPAEGVLSFDFSGTVLVSGLNPGGSVQTTGDVKKEFSDDKYNKQVYFGHGHMTIDGKYKGIQFFGRSVNATFNGFGIVRLVGEFDRNLDTGTYWYALDPNTKMPWGTNMLQLPVPATYNIGHITPKVRIEKG
jgi:hypothetical protein